MIVGPSLDIIEKNLFQLSNIVLCFRLEPNAFKKASFIADTYYFYLLMQEDRKYKMYSLNLIYI